MKTPRSIISLTLFLTIAAAIPQHAQGSPDDHAWRAAHPVQYDVLEAGNDGVYLEPVVLVATSEAQWNQAMAELESDHLLTVVPGPPPPSGVDWDREAVLLVALGEFEEAHCTIDVREIRRISFRALCDVHVNVMGPPRIQTVISPYVIVKMSKRGVVRSAAARYEYTFPGSPNASVVKYSDQQAFTTPAPEPKKEISWSGLKRFLPEF
jgi:hypothetical protein